MTEPLHIDIESAYDVVSLAQREVRAARDVGVVIVDCQYRIRALEGGLYRGEDDAVPGWHLSASGAIGMELREAVGEPAWERLKPLYDAALAGDERRFDYVSIDQEHAFDVRVTPLLDADARVCGALAAVQDVSLRWRAEREQQRADEFLRGALANMAEGVYALDERGRLTFLNPAGEALLGYSEAELKGQFLHEIIHYRYEDGRPRPREECPLGDVLTSGATYRTEDDVFIRKDGRPLHVAYSCSPLPAPSNGTVRARGAIVAFRDVTERRREEHERTRDLEALGWLERVRDALDEDGFVVHGQPIVNARSGDLIGEELLIRMHDEDGGIVPPGAFLPAAERYGLVYDIDVWMFNVAAELAATGRHVAVNVSASTIGRPAALESIRSAIEHHGCDPRLICVEITETALINDLPEARRFATGLAELGVRLALDDFGTGYASLMHLKSLPITYIKIDIEFVRDLANNRRSRNVVQALVALAHGGEMTTIAEGVEDQATLEILRELHVDLVQGFHIGRPTPLRRGEPSRMSDAVARHRHDD